MRASNRIYEAVEEQGSDNLLDLIAYCKVSQLNFQYLHRYLKDENFYVIHDKMQEFYDKCSELVDILCEAYITKGLIEPTMAYSLGAYQEIPIQPREQGETLTISKDIINTLIEKINLVYEELTKDEQISVDPFIEFFAKETKYKLTQSMDN